MENKMDFMTNCMLNKLYVGKKKLWDKLYIGQVENVDKLYV